MSSVAASSRPTLKALLGAPSRPHYRRSTTTRAPRKRTFVNLEMTKYNPGVTSSGTGSVLCKATACSASELLATACCGGNDNNRRGGANGGNGGNRPPRGPGGSDGSAGQPQPQPVPRALVVGAAALMAGLVLLPSQQAAASGPGLPRSLRVAGATSASSSTPRSMCLNNNNNNNAPASTEDGAILYGSVVLSDAERRLMARSSRQLFFSEYVRVGASGSARV